MKTLKITKQAARELIRSETALTKGLPSEVWMDHAMDQFMAAGSWQLGKQFWVSVNSADNSFWLEVY
jgi:hypothetical protein